MVELWWQVGPAERGGAALAQTMWTGLAPLVPFLLAFLLMLALWAWWAVRRRRSRG